LKDGKLTFKFDILERVFRRKELKTLRASNALLIQMNKELLESKINLDRQERIVLMECMNDPHFRDRVAEPNTPHLVRVKYKGVKEKILAGFGNELKN
jgi:hypothetical protein